MKKRVERKEEDKLIDKEYESYLERQKEQQGEKGEQENKRNKYSEGRFKGKVELLWKEEQERQEGEERTMNLLDLQQ